MSLHHDEVSVGVQMFFDRMFSELSRTEGGYCVLHSYEDLPSVTSDLDIAVMNTGLVDFMSFIYGGNTEWQVVQDLHYDVPSCRYVVLRRLNGDRPHLLALDICSDPWGINRYRLSSFTLLKDRRPLRNFYVPSPAIEAFYILIKRIQKGYLPQRDVERIAWLQTQQAEKFSQLLHRYLGNTAAEEIQSLLDARAWDQLASRVGFYRTCLRRQDWLRRPGLRIRYWAYELARRFRRFVQPTGMVMVILGPDGSGKSTVAKGLMQWVSKAFRRTAHYHWRPGVLPPLATLAGRGRVSDEEVTDPHKSPPSNRLVSLARLLYYTVDFILGYWLRFYPAKARTTLIVIERYFYDFLVDPRRYRLQLPEWLPRLLLPLIPKPDLIFVLTAPLDVLAERKQELPMDELAYQCRVYEELAELVPRVHLVDASRPLDEVLSHMTDVVLETLAERVKKRMAGALK
jgi:thymidylate kinase